jgi:hypothetical protein
MNHTRDQELHMACLSMRGDNAVARFDYEKEMDRQLMVLAYLNLEKSCKYCENGNFNDGFHRTHTLNRCPRLACMTCTYCKQTGHTKSKCVFKGNDDLWHKSDIAITEYIVDFDNETIGN